MYMNELSTHPQASSASTYPQQIDQSLVQLTSVHFRTCRCYILSNISCILLGLLTLDIATIRILRTRSTLVQVIGAGVGTHGSAQDNAESGNDRLEEVHEFGKMT